jgi:hypothetical protein
MSSHANVIIGSRLVFDKLFIKKTGFKCHHKPSVEKMFCPECGCKQELLLDCILKPGDTDAKYGFRIGNYDISNTTNEQEYFIGLTFSTANLEYPKKNSVKVDLGVDYSAAINKIKQELKDILSPYDLWDEDSFGIWATGKCSY